MLATEAEPYRADSLPVLHSSRDDSAALGEKFGKTIKDIIASGRIMLSTGQSVDSILTFVSNALSKCTEPTPNLSLHLEKFRVNLQIALETDAHARQDITQFIRNLRLRDRKMRCEFSASTAILSEERQGQGTLDIFLVLLRDELQPLLAWAANLPVFIKKVCSFYPAESLDAEKHLADLLQLAQKFPQAPDIDFYPRPKAHELDFALNKKKFGEFQRAASEEEKVLISSALDGQNALAAMVFQLAQNHSSVELEALQKTLEHYLSDASALIRYAYCAVIEGSLDQSTLELALKPFRLRIEIINTLRVINLYSNILRGLTQFTECEIAPGTPDTEHMIRVYIQTLASFTGVDEYISLMTHALYVCLQLSYFSTHSTETPKSLKLPDSVYKAIHEISSDECFDRAERVFMSGLLGQLLRCCEHDASTPKGKISLQLVHDTLKKSFTDARATKGIQVTQQLPSMSGSFLVPNDTAIMNQCSLMEDGQKYELLQNNQLLKQLMQLLETLTSKPPWIAPKHGSGRDRTLPSHSFRSTASHVAVASRLTIFAPHEVTPDQKPPNLNEGKLWRRELILPSIQLNDDTTCNDDVTPSTSSEVPDEEDLDCAH